MKPVLTSAQIREVDTYTIQHEPISSLDLMERASKAFVNLFTTLSGRGKRIFIFCGPGNNGGDGLAISRLLKEQGFEISTFVVGDSLNGSSDFKENLKRLSTLLAVNYIENESHFPQFDHHHIVIDALFGSGLSRTLGGIYELMVKHINQSGTEIYAVDIASGLYADHPFDGTTAIKPHHTITFQSPKAAFFMPELYEYVGTWHLVNIGLDRRFIDSMTTSQYYTEPTDLSSVLPRRSVFMHKGGAGKIQIISGSRGKMGAAVLCTRAAIKSGAGLVFVQSPSSGRDILQIAVPEAMVIDDAGSETIQGITLMQGINAVAIGPGIGTSSATAKAFERFLSAITCPLVIDADAINLLSSDSRLLEYLPQECILTPHPGEFERLVGKWENDFQKIELLKNFCLQHQVNIVLKGAYSAVCNSSGNIYYNCTGNPGMATGGSGDVLTGIIVALLGQGIGPFEALRLGVYLHGLSGDLGAKAVGEVSLSASDIIFHLPEAFKTIVHK